MRKQKEAVTVEETPRVLSVGDKIVVNHASDGQGKLVRSKETIEEVSAVYLDGSVRIGAGDVYDVEPCSSGKAKWQTKWPKKDKWDNS